MCPNPTIANTTTDMDHETMRISPQTVMRKSAHSLPPCGGRCHGVTEGEAASNLITGATREPPTAPWSSKPGAGFRHLPRKGGEGEEFRDFLRREKSRAATLTRKSGIVELVASGGVPNCEGRRWLRVHQS